MTALDDIIARTRADLPERQAALPMNELREQCATIPPCRDFVGSLLPSGDDETRVIAEVKRRSPSAGWIRAEYDSSLFMPEVIAREYEAAGAAAISCLTEQTHFSGNIEYINRIKKCVALPVLRKDFIIDPWQVWESRAAGADAVLLIAECLEGERLRQLAGLAASIGLDLLIEIHTPDNLDRALAAVVSTGGKALLGVNNRDLSSMRVDLEHTLNIARRIVDYRLLVSESGIRSSDDLVRLRKAGVHRVLVGETLMRDPHPGRALSHLLKRTAS